MSQPTVINPLRRIKKMVNGEFSLVIKALDQLGIWHTATKKTPKLVFWRSLGNAPRPLLNSLFYQVEKNGISQ